VPPGIRIYDNLWIYILLSCHSKKAGDERALTHNVPSFHTTHLLFAFHVTRRHPTSSAKHREARCHLLVADFPWHSRYT
jgi:hypothetical protein